MTKIHITASREIDQAIAEQVGWSIRPDRGFYALYDAESNLIDTGFESTIDARTRIPKFTTSVDAALSLPLPADSYWEIKTEPRGSRAELHEVIEERYFDSEEPTLALAICKAWLAWKWGESEGK